MTRIERYKQHLKESALKEDGVVMSAGTGGFSSNAKANGPVAGFDPIMSKKNRIKKRILATPPASVPSAIISDNH